MLKTSNVEKISNSGGKKMEIFFKNHVNCKVWGNNSFFRTRAYF